MNFVVGGLVLLAAALLFAFLAAQDVALPANRAARITEIVRTGSMTLAGAVAALCFVRFRLGAETAVVLIGSAVLVLGVVVVGAASVVLPVVKADDPSSSWLNATRAGGLLVVLLLLVLAIVVPEVDTRRRGSRVVVGSLLLAGLLAVVLNELPRTAEVLAFGRRFPMGEATTSTSDRLVLSAVWSLLALVLCARGIRRRRTILAASGLMLLALALSELIAIDAAVVTDVRLLGAEALQVLALALLLVGVVGDFERNFLDQRARLLDTTIAMRSAQTQARLGTAVSGRRRHEVANALMGLEGAASTLERFYDRLDGVDRKRLAEMVAESVDRLRNLSAEDPARPHAFPLTDVTAPLLARFSEAGLATESSVPDDIAVRALADEVGEVLEQVAKAVLDESPEGPVRLSAVRFGETAWLSVEFKPASSANGASANLGRLRRRMTPRGNEALGRGMDLSVAAHMIRERGGQLLAEPVGTGEVAVRLQLPAATADA